MAHLSTPRGVSIGTVTVVIPCFNGEGYLAEALASVLAQTHADLEVIVVDDGSTDGSLAIARSTGDPRVRVVVQANAGVAAARNRGVAEARGEYVAFLDQDDLWLPPKLELQLVLLGRSPEVGLVYSDCLLIAEDGAELGRWSARYPLLRGRVFERLIVDSVVAISTVLLPRAIFERVGGFRPSFRYVEDLDLILRVAERNPIDVVGVPMAKYRLHPASVSRSLGLEVAVEEMLVLCEEWIAWAPSRRAVVTRALARYLYIAGKTAFYRGDDEQAGQYLHESWRRHPTIRARLFAELARRAPRSLRRVRAAIMRVRGQAGPAPGPIRDPSPDLRGDDRGGRRAVVRGTRQ